MGQGWWGRGEERAGDTEQNKPTRPTKGKMKSARLFIGPRGAGAERSPGVQRGRAASLPGEAGARGRPERGRGWAPHLGEGWRGGSEEAGSRGRWEPGARGGE